MGRKTIFENNDDKVASIQNYQKNYNNKNKVKKVEISVINNAINRIIKDESFGKPDEIRLELARELKKSAKERKEMTSQIGTAQKLNDKCGYL